MGHAGVGGSCSGVGHLGVGWMGYAGVGWVMQGLGGSCWGGVCYVGGVGHAWVGWVMQGWSGVTSK